MPTRTTAADVPPARYAQYAHADGSTATVRVVELRTVTATVYYLDGPLADQRFETLIDKLALEEEAAEPWTGKRNRS